MKTFTTDGKIKKDGKANLDFKVMKIAFHIA
jgi:hypothetical protein